MTALPGNASGTKPSPPSRPPLSPASDSLSAAGSPPRTNKTTKPPVCGKLGRARSLIEPHGGTIVAKYFDIGETRALPWKRRPQAAALLTALADPQRGFDAVAIGEPQRAFYGT